MDGRKKNGGPRPNSGRKVGYRAPHTLKTEVLRATLIKQYEENALEINKALIDKAKTGEVAAIKELFDRVWGKSMQPMNIENKETKEPLNEKLKEEKRKAWRAFIAQVRPL